MSTEPKTLNQLPLFPLPGGALIPGDLKPLHIFEPRYRRMLDVVREGGRLMAIATIVPGYEAAACSDPPLDPVVGVGRLMRDRPRSDGTSDIVLHGLARGELLAEGGDDEPFRRGQVLLYPDTGMHPVESFRLQRGLLLSLADRLKPQRLSYDVTAEVDVGKLVDRIAADLDLPQPEEVRMMQAVDLHLRISELLDLLRGAKYRKRLRNIIPSLHTYHLSLERRSPGRGPAA